MEVLYFALHLRVGDIISNAPADMRTSLPAMLYRKHKDSHFYFYYQHLLPKEK